MPAVDRRFVPQLGQRRSVFRGRWLHCALRRGTPRMPAVERKFVHQLGLRRLDSDKICIFRFVERVTPPHETSSHALPEVLKSPAMRALWVAQTSSTLLCFAPRPGVPDACGGALARRAGPTNARVTHRSSSCRLGASHTRNTSSADSLVQYDVCKGLFFLVGARAGI